MAKFEKKQKAGSPEWMGTYGDLVTLLLCFFIMMFATSSVDSGKYEKLLEAFNPSILEQTGGSNLITSEESTSNEELNQLLSEELAYQNELNSLQEQLLEYIASQKLEDSVEVIRDSSSVTLRLNSSLLFNSGDASLKSEAKPYLKSLSKTFDTDFDIRIEGHTDNLPIKNSKYESNWDLSALRAIHVLDYLVQSCNINSNKLSVAGYGEQRPIADNSTEKGRKQNRRVDIVLLKTDYTSKN